METEWLEVYGRGPGERCHALRQGGGSRDGEKRLDSGFISKGKLGGCADRLNVYCHE